MCSPLSHTTKLQGGCFSDSRGRYGCEPTTIQQATIQREGFLQPLLAAPKHTQAQGVSAAVSDTRPNQGTLCASRPAGASPSPTAPHPVLQGKPRPPQEPQGCVMGLVFLWFPPGLVFLLLTLALPIKPGFFSPIISYHEDSTASLLCFSRVQIHPGINSVVQTRSLIPVFRASELIS